MSGRRLSGAQTTPGSKTVLARHCRSSRSDRNAFQRRRFGGSSCQIQRRGPTATVERASRQQVNVDANRLQPCDALKVAGAQARWSALRRSDQACAKPSASGGARSARCGPHVGPHFRIASPRQLKLKPLEALRVYRDALRTQAMASALGGELERDPATAKVGRSSDGDASPLCEAGLESRAPAVEMVRVARREVLAEVSAEIGHLQGET